MAFRHGSAGARRVVVARLHGIAIDFAGGYREGLTRGQTLAALAAVSTDPDLLAEAAAIHATADNWYAIAAVDLLIEAGADQGLIQRYIGEHGLERWASEAGWGSPGTEAVRRAS